MRNTLSIAFLCFSASLAYAGDDDSGITSAPSWGYIVSQVVDKPSCSVTVDVDEKKVTDDETFLTLRKLGILNKSLPDNEARRKPYSLVSVFAVSLLPLTTKEVYDKFDKVDKCKFSVILTYNDDYGNPQKERAITYDFNRMLFKRINWERFESAKVTSVFPNFKISDFVLRKVSEEQ